MWFGRRRGRPVIAAVTELAPYQLPETNRCVGPKLHTAGAPRKCSPAIDDYIPDFRTGYPSTLRMAPARAGSRKGYLVMSTLYPVPYSRWSTSRFVPSLRVTSRRSPFGSAPTTVVLI